MSLIGDKYILPCIYTCNSVFVLIKYALMLVMLVVICSMYSLYHVWGNGILKKPVFFLKTCFFWYTQKKEGI